MEGKHLRSHYKAVESLQEVLSTYDDNMIALAKNIDELTVEYDKELAEFRELNAYFLKVDRDQANQRQEEELIAQERLKETAQRDKMIKRVTKVQAIVRGYFVASGFYKVPSAKKKKKKKKTKKTKKQQGHSKS